MLLLDGAYESEEKFVLRYAEGDDAGEVYKVFEYGKVVELCGHYSIVRRMELFSGGEVLSLKSISRE